MENDTQTKPGTDKIRDGLSYLTMAQSQLLWPQPAVRKQKGATCCKCGKLEIKLISGEHKLSPTKHLVGSTNTHK